MGLRDWFSRVQDEADAVAEPKRLPEVVDWTAQVEQLCRDQIPEIVAAQEGLLVKYQDDVALDSAAFQFECRRWGDFLTLYVKRGGRSRVVSVNIKDDSIELILGEPPDLNGTVGFSISFINPDGSGGYGSCRNLYGTAPKTLGPPPDGYQYRVSPVSPETPWKPDPIYYVQKPEKNDGDYFGPVFFFGAERDSRRRFDTNVTVPNCARPALDDHIMFHNAKSTLFVPFGLGQTVYEQILFEIGSTNADG